MAKFPTYEEMGKRVAEEALDGFIYKDKTLREWIDILCSSENPNRCEDAISRAAAIKAMDDLEQEDIELYGCPIPEGFDGRRAIEALQKLPSVTPKMSENPTGSESEDTE